MQDFIWNELLIKQEFTTLGAARLSQDMKAIERLAPECRVGMGKLLQGVLLLNLPLVADEESPITLVEASSAVYTTNSKTDEMLERLGLDQISRADARMILGRRVEGNE